MTDSVFKDVHAQMLILADGHGNYGSGAYVKSGTLIVSGAKLWIRGASKWELVTSI